jgi:hypothetical protein
MATSQSASGCKGWRTKSHPVVKLEPVKSEPTGKGKGKTKTTRRKSKK